MVVNENFKIILYVKVGLECNYFRLKKARKDFLKKIKLIEYLIHLDILRDLNNSFSFVILDPVI